MKKSLALILSLVLLVSVAVPFSLAAGLDRAQVAGSFTVDEAVVEEPVIEEPAAEEPAAEEPAADEPAADEPVAEEPAVEEPTVEEPVEEPVVEETVVEELVEETVLAPVEEDVVEEAAEDGATSISAITMGTKPSDGTASGVPFSYGVAGSNSFRIPALVNYGGALVAAADVRWNTTYDGGGLDTIVARSYDSGSSWSYTIANYLGDNGNVYNGGSSTAFIDPALAVSGGTIYMICDLYPYGVALNGTDKVNPCEDVGFNDAGYLLLSGDDHSSYGYYLKGDTIYSSDGTAVEGYTVDEYFNITATDGSTSSLFFSNSPYKVVRTGFLYLTKSTDGGASWSAPTLLDLKTTSEQVCLVAPGAGLVTSSGMIVFPVYSFHGDNDPSGNTQRMSFLYSYDGSTWSRSSEFSYNWASESAAVELEDGSLRFFFRNGSTNLCYVDYSFSTGWGSAVNTGVDTNSNCQMSAITHSETLDGKQLILVSCPTGPSEAGSNQSSASYRLNGKIFAFTVESDGSLAQVGSIAVTSDDAPFMYSCMAELNDGSVAILYENKENAWGTGSSCYYTMDFAVYDLEEKLDITFDGDDSGDSGETEGSTSIADEATGVTVSTESTTGTLLTELSVSAGAVVSESNRVRKVYDITVNGGAYTGAATVTIPYDTAFDACSIFWGEADGDVFPVEKTDAGFLCHVPHFSEITVNGSTGTVILEVGEEDSVTISNVNVADTTIHNDYVTVVVDGTDPVPATTTVTFTGVAPGTTEVTVGGVTFNVTVNAKTAEKSLALKPGDSATLDALDVLGFAADGGYEVTYAADSLVTLSGATVTAGDTEGSSTVTATVSKNDVTYGTVTYNITISKVAIKDTQNIYIPVGGTATIDGLSGDIIPNGFLDDAIATISPSSGTMSEDDSLTITGVVEGSTAVVVGTTKINIFVTNNAKDTHTKYVYISVVKIENCTVYYSINGGTLYEVIENGVLLPQSTYDEEYNIIDQYFADDFNIMFFASPDEGYVLTEMSATGTSGGSAVEMNDFYSLANGEATDGTDSDAWPFAASYNWSALSEDEVYNLSNSDTGIWKQLYNSENKLTTHGFRWCLLEGNMTISQMQDLFTRALKLGCQGVTTVTKNKTSDAFYGYFSFKSEKLPTLEKSILKVTRNNVDIGYTEGTKLEFGDVITYQFTVTSYSTAVDYADIVLKDETIDYTKEDIPGSTFDTANTYTYTADYTLTVDDVDKYTGGEFHNTATLEYSYSSDYSSGSYGGTAEGSVSCQINGIVSYQWAADLPEAITNQTLPAQHAQTYGTTYTVSGNTYDDVVDAGGTWTFKGWKSSVDGVIYQPGAAQTMPGSGSVVYTGIWEYTAKVTINYVVVGPDGCGTVTPESETLAADGDASGSTAAASSNVYKFVGWYSDEECVNLISTDAKYVPSKPADGWVDGTTYYAKFEYNLTSLTINKALDENTTLEELDQNFIFTVTSGGKTTTVVITAENMKAGLYSVVVDGLTVGETVTVTEETGWSWRYTPDAVSKEAVLAAAGNSVTFTNTRGNTQWLDGSHSVVNTYN